MGNLIQMFKALTAAGTLVRWFNELVLLSQIVHLMKQHRVECCSVLIWQVQMVGSSLPRR